MKLTLDRAPLLAALSRAHRVVERRNTIPILANLRLRAEGAALTITATDLDIEITQGLPAEIAEPGATTAPAHTLHDIVRKLPEGAQVQMETVGDRASLTVRAGRSRFTLQTLPENEFPDFSGIQEGVALAMPGEQLADAFKRVQFAISTEEMRYYLNGIHMHRRQEEDGTHRLALVATDGHRLAFLTLAPESLPEALPSLILPRKAVGEILRLAEDSGEEKLKLEIAPNRLAASTGRARIVTKLIDGTFPDYGRVIPWANAKRARLKAAELAAAVDRVGTVASTKGRAVKFAFAAGKLSLAVTNPDAGEAQEELECDYAEEPMEIGFNSQYLLGILSAIDAKGDIEIALQDPGGPTILRRPNVPHALCVLMPMRV